MECHQQTPLHECKADRSRLSNLPLDVSQSSIHRVNPTSTQASRQHHPYGLEGPSGPGLMVSSLVVTLVPPLSVVTRTRACTSCADPNTMRGTITVILSSVMSESSITWASGNPLPTNVTCGS